MIRVGRITYNPYPKAKYPKFPDFIEIRVMTKSSAYGDLGPYVLQDEEGRIMENMWQSAKIYDVVPASTQCRSLYDRTVIWEHPKETHLKLVKRTGNITEYDIMPEYWNWREKLESAKEAIRYPVGKKHRKNCVGVILDEDLSKDCVKLLGYIEARKKVYLETYLRLVKKEPKFAKLQKMLAEGKNLLITEIDGPHQEDLEYYMKRYGVDEKFIENDTMLATKENLEIMLNDKKWSWGHGYCTAWALLGL